MGAPVPFTGSKILQAWTEQRRLERAITDRTRRGMREAPFAGAAIGRLTASLAQWSGSINSDLDQALVPLRARARRYCSNSEYGKRFLSLVGLNVVGPTGPTLQVRAKTGSNVLDKPANDAIETHFARWSRVADIAGRMKLAQLLRVEVKGTARDGEGLIRIVRARELPYGIALQALEPDRLAENLNLRLQNGNVIRQGVEIDTRLRPVAYHLWTSHPGENFTGIPSMASIERVAAADIIHPFIQERAEQVRGFSWLHAALPRGNMLYGYEEAAVVAARVGASKMGVWQKRADASAVADLTQLADGGVDADGNLQVSAEPGEFIEGPEGYELVKWDPQYPHENFESMVKQCLRGLAMGLDVATHNLSGDMTGVNYSSARIAELSERDMWVLLQEWANEAVCMRIYREWLAIALLRGDITFPDSGKSLPADKFTKFADASGFQGRRWEWTDPRNETEASRGRVALAVDSRTRIAASQGRDFEDIVAELKQEKELLDAAGLSSTAESDPVPPDPAANKEEVTQ